MRSSSPWTFVPDWSDEPLEFLEHVKVLASGFLFCLKVYLVPILQQSRSWTAWGTWSGLNRANMTLGLTDSHQEQLSLC